MEHREKEPTSSIEVVVQIPKEIEGKLKDPVRDHQKIKEAIGDIRTEYLGLVPLSDIEKVFLVLEQQARGEYCAVAEYTGTETTKIILFPGVFSQQGVVIGEEQKGYSVEDGELEIKHGTLVSEMLHHLDNVFSFRNDMDGYFDTSWRKELVDVSIRLVGGKKPNWFEGKYLGLLRKDIFADEINTPVDFDYRHLFAIEIAKATYELGVRCDLSMNVIRDRFLDFSLKYRPPLPYLNMLAEAARVPATGEIETIVLSILEDRETALFGTLLGSGHTDLLKISKNDLVVLSEESGLTQERTRALLSLMTNPASSVQAGQEILSKHPKKEELFKIEDRLIELRMRFLHDVFLAQNASEWRFDGERAKKDIALEDAVGVRAEKTGIRRPALSFFRYHGDDKDEQEKKKTLESQLKKQQEIISKLREDPIDDAMDKATNDFERRINILAANRIRIIELQTEIATLMIETVPVFGKKEPTKKYPTELARLTDPEELAFELGIEIKH